VNPNGNSAVQFCMASTIAYYVLKQISLFFYIIHYRHTYIINAHHFQSQLCLLDIVAHSKWSTIEVCFLKLKMETEQVSEILGTFLPLSCGALVFSLSLFWAFSLILMVNWSQSNIQPCQILKTRSGTSSQILYIYMCMYVYIYICICPLSEV
jgi:hypothetical protein